MNEEVLYKYDLYLNTPYTGQIQVAKVVLLEKSGTLDMLALQYTTEYLSHPNRFSLAPSTLPLTSNPIDLICYKGTPGILDDYLPDDWGRKVLARKALYQKKKKINALSDIEILKELTDSRIGAVHWIDESLKPDFSLGCDIAKIKEAESAAQIINNPIESTKQLDELSLLYLANNGTGVGGARPKALVQENGIGYLAKFNQLTKDDYNNARVELMCLRLAKKAGLIVPEAKVISGINGRDVLLIERFDIVYLEHSLSRRHLITVNALLKDKETHQNNGGVFRYDDIDKLISQHSINPIKDKEQLLRVMLFNAFINNTDTHERNFSFINDGSGYRLSPAYDMVPSLVVGEYPEAGYKYSQHPVHPKRIKAEGKIFGIAKKRCCVIADEVVGAFENWTNIAKDCNVSSKDQEQLENVIK